MLDSTYRRALITGASSGIGKATALALAKANIPLALVGRSKERLVAVVEATRAIGVDARFYCIDLDKVEQVKSAIHGIVNDCGPVDLLINSAGMGYTGELMDTPLSDWQRVLELNLTSVFQVLQAVIPSMRELNQGLIVNVASIAGRQSFPGWGAYSVSKAGLIALSKTITVEERGNGIRSVIVCPGAVNTPIWDTETVQSDFDRSGMLSPETVAQTILHAVSLPSYAVIEDITIMPSAGAL
ncbi:MAG: SDR family oxidoreductase [Cyanobacteria bacterium P01_F01_bin.150]